MMRKLPFIKTLLIAALLTAALPLGCSKKAVRPADEPQTPEQYFVRANKLIEQKQYDKAREMLLEAKARDNSGKYAPLAQLRLADTYYRDNDAEQAVQEYRRFLEVYPDNKYASYAQYQIGMIYFSQIGDAETGYGAAERALKEFTDLKRNYPRNPYKSVLEMRMEKCNDIIAGYQYLVGEFYFKKKAYQGAISRFKEVLREFPDYRKAPQVLYMTAVSYSSLGDKAQAEHYLQLLASKYPDDALGKKALKDLNQK
jgi:outer membrane protein assembly factor BamD